MNTDIYQVRHQYRFGRFSDGTNTRARHWGSRAEAPLHSRLLVILPPTFLDFVAAECLRTHTSVTTIFLDLSFAAERWLRHRGRLARNSGATEKALSIFSIIFAIAGTCGLILLSIFDTLRHPRLHDGFLLLFMLVSQLLLRKCYPVNAVLGAATSSQLSSSVRNINGWACTSGNTVSSGAPFGSSSLSS